MSNVKFSLLVRKPIQASYSSQEQILELVNQSELPIPAKNKSWRQHALWCHNRVCIAWYKQSNWPITACIIWKLIQFDIAKLVDLCYIFKTN